jgi:hypothetical protein
MGGSGGATFNKGLNRVAGTPKGSTDIQVTHLMWIKNIWVVAVALHLIGINRVPGTLRGSYISPGNTFNVDIEYIWVVAVVLHLIQALKELRVHQEVATDPQVTHLMWI